MYVDIQLDYQYVKKQRYSKKDRRRLGLREDQNETIMVIRACTVAKRGKCSVIETGRILGIDNRDPDYWLIHCENATYRMKHYGNHSGLNRGEF